MEIRIGGRDTGSRRNVSRRIHLLDEYVNLEGKSVLDCGCGAGNYALEIFEYTSDVKGIEFNSKKVEDFYQKETKGVEVIQGDIQKMPFDDESFDVVFFNEVIEHVPNDQKALDEIFRVLKPSGKLFLVSPNRCYPFETHGTHLKHNQRFVQPYVPFIPYIPEAVSKHLFKPSARNYFPNELMEMVQETGFGVEDQFFISQSFENGGKRLPSFYNHMAPYLRKVARLCEQIPGVCRVMGVAQIVVASKPTVTSSAEATVS